MFKKTQKRIGIYAGTFNPVHSGHIAFALQALRDAHLDEVVFLPERRPRGKVGVEHFGHRVAMLTRVTAPYSRMSVAELVDARFTVNRTLRHLRTLFPGSTFVFLVGSDVVTDMVNWPDSARLLKESELFVGTREGYKTEVIRNIVGRWEVQPRALRIVESHAADISSSQVRQAIRDRQKRAGVLASVVRYASQNWLYVGLPSHPVN